MAIAGLLFGAISINFGLWLVILGIILVVMNMKKK